MEANSASEFMGMGDLLVALTSQSIDVYAACLVWLLAAWLAYSCFCYRSFAYTHYHASHNYQYGNHGAVVIGNCLMSNYTTVEACKLKVVALDAKDNILESAVLPRGTSITLNITTQGNIDTVQTSQAKIVVASCGSITTLRNSQGDIRVDVAGNIETIRNSMGDIDIKSCNTVGGTKNSMGDIKVRQRSPARPAPT